MDYETIQNKSMADLKEIAGMLGIKVPRSCTKAKLIAMITGEETEEAPPAQEEAKNVSGLAGATEEKAQKETAEKPAAEKAPEKQPANDQPSQPAKAQPEQPANAAEEGGRKKGRPKKSAKPVNAVPAETPAEKNAATPAPDASKEEEKPAASETPKNGEKTGKKKAGRPKKEAKAEKATGPAATAGAEPETAGAAAPDTGTPAQEEKPVAPSENSAEKNPEAPQTAEGGKKREFQENTSEVTGLLDIMTDGYGFLRTGRYFTGSKDVFVPPNFIRKYALRTGDEITGRSRPQRDNDKYPALFYITEINGFPPEAAFSRTPFESLTPIYPDEQIKLETTPKELSTRIIDLFAPIGKGQRGMIVSPPKAGKTVLLKKIANAITRNYPDIKLIVLLIDERPEEVTDMRESIDGEVVSSTFDEMPERHIKVAEMVFERARRLVEFGNDVVILMDSLTRLARAYNITITPTGRSLSGGLDPGALYNPKRFFGAARNIRGGGSLTIIATALIDTGSKMDDVIFEEFKGTGNMELHLDRKLSEKRVFPAIEINKSGTRKEELLLTPSALNAAYGIRKSFASAGVADITESVITQMLRNETNEEFIKTVNLNYTGNGK